MKRFACTKFAICLLTVVSSCSSDSKSRLTAYLTPALNLSCVSNSQEYGDYNRRMEYMKTNRRETKSFAIKFNGKLLEICDTSKERYVTQEMIKEYNRKGDTYYFKSGITIGDDDSPEHDATTRYIIDQKGSTLCIISKKSIFAYSAAIFHMNCQ